MLLEFAERFSDPSGNLEDGCEPEKYCKQLLTGPW